MMQSDTMLFTTRLAPKAHSTRAAQCRRRIAIHCYSVWLLDNAQKGYHQFRRWESSKRSWA